MVGRARSKSRRCPDWSTFHTISCSSSPKLPIRPRPFFATIWCQNVTSGQRLCFKRQMYICYQVLPGVLNWAGEPGQSQPCWGEKCEGTRVPPFLICKKVESDGDWRYADGLTDDCLNACTLAAEHARGKNWPIPPSMFFRGSGLFLVRKLVYTPIHNKGARLNAFCCW